jgi:DNA mismatch repair protein MutL
MSDVIKLLPSHIANQIAAGEVVQRPASVVKELIENSIDSGATKIELVAKDGGKTLIQVVDNGCGMSKTDALKSFERHATSKISTAEDLFQLQTKGFRGEALASIAAIAHVQLKTKLHDAELGTEIINEGSKIVSNEEAMCSDGTSIAVKNLFFNVPARRNFLGKNTTEYRKVLEEFIRIALVHPEIEMKFYHDKEEIFNVPKSNVRQRIVSLYGKAFNERLVPVNEETDIVKISGFVTKPAYSKTKLDQSFLFVNDRYFKDRYFNHAVMNAYDGLIPNGKFPPYFIYFEVPTNSIDVNVHPTKTEIRFEENQAIYAFLRSAVKQALGQFNVMPSIDFEQETSFSTMKLSADEQVKMPEIKVNPAYNPFETTKATNAGVTGDIKSSGFSQIKPNKDFLIGSEQADVESEIDKFQGDNEHNTLTYSSSMDEEDKGVKIERKKPIQINQKYILTALKKGFILIDQYRAHARILYDELMLENSKAQSQQLLFEERIKVEPQDISYWNEILEAINELGFDLKLEENEVVIKGQPAQAKDNNPSALLLGIIDSYKTSELDEAVEIKSKLALSLATGMAVKGGSVLTIEEMEHIIDALFASSSPQISPHGKKIIETFTMDEIIKRFS